MLIREETTRATRSEKCQCRSLSCTPCAPITKRSARPSYLKRRNLLPWCFRRGPAAATTAGGRAIKDVESRRYLQAWRPITTRHGLYHIVKRRLSAAADFLDEVGDSARAVQLRQASTYWLRHTFAKAAPLSGQDVRNVAVWTGHCDLSTTMVYPG